MTTVLPFPTRVRLVQPQLPGPVLTRATWLRFGRAARVGPHAADRALVGRTGIIALLHGPNEWGIPRAVSLRLEGEPGLRRFLLAEIMPA